MIDETDLETNRWVNLVAKTVIVTLTGFGVSYLRNIGVETSQLNVSIIGLKAEIQVLSTQQGEITRALRDRMAAVEKRIEWLERRVKQ